jgi:hypothetical protein
MKSATAEWPQRSERILEIQSGNTVLLFMVYSLRNGYGAVVIRQTRE